MRIRRIDEALERCGEHLSEIEIIDKEVESLLAQSMLILICAEFERKLRELILERCSSVSDVAIREYIGNCTRVRSLKASDVSGLLAQFGEICKSEFRRLLEENGEAATLYESIRNNRNRVAHGEGSNATFRDVKQYYEGGHLVLDYFREALWGGEAGRQIGPIEVGYDGA